MENVVILLRLLGVELEQGLSGEGVVCGADLRESGKTFFKGTFSTRSCFVTDWQKFPVLIQNFLHDIISVKYKKKYFPTKK